MGAITRNASVINDFDAGINAKLRNIEYIIDHLL